VNPSYFELFAANDYVTSYYAGNPNLVPEQNRSFDIGVEVPVWQGRGVIDVTYFNETLTNEIEFYDTLTTTGSGKPIYSYRNQAGESTRKGLEIAGELQATDALDLRLSYTYLNAKNPDGSVEVRRPEHELSLGATLAAFNGRGSINADIRRVVGNYGSRFFAPWGTVRLPDYTTVDLAVEYNLSDSVVLTGRVTNLCDVVYSDVLGFAKRGRTAYVGLKSAF
jgi:vitamin B12 transporter